MARRKNTKRIDPRYFLNESAFLDGVERLQQKYGVRVMVSDPEGRYGVSVVHRKEDRLPGDDPQFETYDDLEQAEADIISRRKQQKMEFEPSKLGPKSHREKAAFDLNEEEVDEGIENITPENVQIAADAIRQVVANLAPAAILPALMLIYKEYKGKKKGE